MRLVRFKRPRRNKRRVSTNETVKYYSRFQTILSRLYDAIKMGGMFVEDGSLAEADHYRRNPSSIVMALVDCSITVAPEHRLDKGSFRALGRRFNVR